MCVSVLRSVPTINNMVVCLHPLFLLMCLVQMTTTALMMVTSYPVSYTKFGLHRVSFCDLCFSLKGWLKVVGIITRQMQCSYFTHFIINILSDNLNSLCLSLCSLVYSKNSISSLGKAVVRYASSYKSKKYPAST